MTRRAVLMSILLFATATAAVWVSGRDGAHAQTGGPEMLHPRLGVRAMVSGLVTPIGIAFLGPREALVIEK